MPRGKATRPRPRRARKGKGLEKRLATVERSLRAGRETKIVRTSGSINLSSAINNSSKLLNLLPDIPQNATSGGRIGNEVRLKRLVMKSWIRYAPTDVNNAVPLAEANMMMRMLIIRQKDQRSAVGLISGVNFVSDELLESGEATQANGFRNIMSPLNRDLFVSKQDRKFKLTNNVDGPGANTDVGANPYNFKVNNKTITFGKMGKKLTFSKDAGTVQPFQFPWVYTGVYSTCTGNPAPFSTAYMEYDITAYYTDA